MLLRTLVKSNAGKDSKDRTESSMRRRHRLSKMALMKRNSERKGRSFIVVIVFLGLFLCMLLLEVLYVDDERTGVFENNIEDNNNFFRMLGFGSSSSSGVNVINENKEQNIELPPRVARELARILPEAEVEEGMSTHQPSNPATTESVQEKLAEPDHWQGVRGTKDKFYVFSAHYDDRRGRFVRIIAAARTRMAEKVVCKFWYNDGRQSVTVYATNKLIRENWNLKYSAYFVLCPLKLESIQIPDSVSILRHGDKTVSNRLLVHYNKKDYKDQTEGIAVCVKPLHYDYNKIINLVEFLELNTILGVRHFVLYNHTVGQEASCILDRYIKEGIVTLLPWQLNMVSQKEIRTEGLFAALNDCLYRTMYRFKYVLMVDLDEFIIPYRNDSLTDMLTVLLSKNPDRTGSYSFQNAFFYLQWPNDESSKSLPYPLLTLQKTKRKSKLHAHKQRSKCIVLPERIIEMGNHFVWEFLPGKTMFNIPPDIGFLHHYRVCEFGGNDCINTTNSIDRRVYAWKEQLLRNVTARLKGLQNKCQLVKEITGG